jgi:hypothetical protein
VWLQGFSWGAESDRPLWQESSIEADPAMARYGARMLSILETPAPLGSDARNELTPRGLPLSAAAERSFTARSFTVTDSLSGYWRPVSHG